MTAATRKITKTMHHKSFIESEIASALYQELRDNIVWQNGVPSRKHGFTRKARAISLNDNAFLQEIITNTLTKLGIEQFILYGIYLNYYRDGNDWTPNHSHPKQRQIIISLGASRKLEMGKRSYNLANGDVMVFGSGIHGVPKDAGCQAGRISVALFISK